MSRTRRQFSVEQKLAILNEADHTVSLKRFVPTLPGLSGSPVLDDKGRLVSVNFTGMSETQSFRDK
jgi:hypothetical protein